MTIGWWARAREALLGVTERGPEPKLDLAPPPIFGPDGWAVDPRVVQVRSRRGWYYSSLATKSGLPKGITWHFTSTAAGTAMAMAVRRRDLERKSFEHPPGSWNFTIPQAGQIIQQLSLRQGAFHAGSPTARKLPIGWANHVTCGIELEGYGDHFTEHQIDLACWLTRAIVRHCGIERANALYQHSWIDPTRKTDPGPEFIHKHSERVLDFAFAPGLV